MKRAIVRSNGAVHRVVLSQPPHFRVGQHPAPARLDDATAAALRAVDAAQFERQHKTIKHGARAVVR